jgi:hypothetical protein
MHHRNRKKMAPQNGANRCKEIQPGANPNPQSEIRNRKSNFDPKKSNPVQGSPTYSNMHFHGESSNSRSKASVFALLDWKGDAEHR